MYNEFEELTRNVAHEVKKVSTNLQVDDINKGKKIDVTGNFFTTKGFTKPAEKIGKYYNIDLNTFKDLEHFAVHIGGNVLIRPRTLVFDTNK